MCTKFQLCTPHSSWGKCDENFWLRIGKKNEEIKGQISSNSLILIYTIHPPMVHVCTKFQLCRPHSSWEKCDKNNVWKLERKIKGQISSSLIPVYTIHTPTVHLCTKFQPTRPHSSWEKCAEKFLMLENWKEKWRNKGMNSIHPLTGHVCTKFHPSSNHSSWEKSDKNFHLTGLRNDRITEWWKEKANPIQPLLFKSRAIKRNFGLWYRHCIIYTSNP